jgi:hypothetical protein
MRKIMTSSIIRALTLAGFTVVLPALPALAFATDNVANGQAVRPAGIQVAANKYECLTDDGYGRKRSCSASYKQENPNWRSSYDCYTDDGYGRYRSCSASYKRKHSKN